MIHTITLTPTDIKNIIIKEFQLSTKDDISFDVDSVCHGYGLAEHYVYELSGITITKNDK
jgi:hypothetical protein